MRALPLTAALFLVARLLNGQCPDGSPPPCRAPRVAPTARTPDPHVIAVLPFRVAGADSTYGEGVAELVAAEFTGEGGPRSADMGTVLRAWQRAGGTAYTPLTQDEAVRVALHVGAGQLVTGSVVGVRGRLTLTAFVVRVPDGMALARTPAVQGLEDSLPELLRRLSASLLVAGTPEGTRQRRELGTASPEAMRAYMAGRAAYRRGRYEEAAGHFIRALEADSGYVLAAFALSQTARWGVDVVNLEEVRATAWRGRDRLGVRDRALLEAELGPRYPESTPRAELLVASERTVAVAPDSPEAWYYLGDFYFHWGAFIGVLDARHRSADALERSLALDSTAGVLEHLLELAILAHDTTWARSLWQAYQRFVPGGDEVRQEQWVVASLLRDTVLLRRAHREADSMSVPALLKVANMLQYAGLAADEATTALSFAEPRSSMRGQRRQFVIAHITAAMNQGRPSDAMAVLERLGDDGQTWADVVRLALGSGGWGGDSAAAAGAAVRLESFADGAVPEDSLRRGQYYVAVCWLARWRLEAGDVSHLNRTVMVLRAASQADRVRSAPFCADLLAAMAEAAGVSGYSGALARFDSIMHTGPDLGPDRYPNLWLARALAARGDIVPALAAVQRRTYSQGLPPAWLAASLREEGRLAALTGDTAGAVRAYRHYLVLRSDPEPNLVPQRDSVRAELARLEANR